MNDVACHLESLGLQSGGPIVIGIPPSPEFHVMFFSASALGLLVLPVLPSGKLPELIRQAQPRVAAGSELFLDEVCARCDSVAHRLEYGPGAAFRFADARRIGCGRNSFATNLFSLCRAPVPQAYHRSICGLRSKF